MTAQPPRPYRKRPPRLAVVDTDSGQIYDAKVHQAKRGGSTITTLYGPHWAAVPLTAYRALAEDEELTRFDLRVLLFLLSKLEPGNHIRMRSVDVATEMETDRHNVARAIRKLRDRKILVDRRSFGWQVNPNYIWRGNPTGLVGKRRDGDLVLLAD